MTQDAPGAALATEDFMIDSDSPGIQLYVRNKRPQSLARFTPERTLLFVHGATYPAETAFDLRLGGVSWMDYVAMRGYDVFLVDVRGYGRSTRPPEMDQPAEANPPVATTETAVADVAAAVRFVLSRRGIGKLNLLGWSWGTTLMGAFTARNNHLVNKLVLNTPQWLRTTPSASDQGGPLGAYRVISVESAKERWLRGVPEDKKDGLIPAGWFDAWADATFATDPWDGNQAPRQLRAPNGNRAGQPGLLGRRPAVLQPG